MKILLVQGFSGGATKDGDTRFAQMRTRVKKTLNEVMLHAEIFYEERRYRDLDDFIPIEQRTEEENMRALQLFDRLDIIVLDGDANRLPWGEANKKVWTLLRMCYLTGKCVFALGGMMQTMVHIVSTGGAQLHVVNNKGFGHPLRSFSKLDANLVRKHAPKPDVVGDTIVGEPEIPGNHVFLDSATGDVYTPAVVSDANIADGAVDVQWKAVMNVGLFREADTAERPAKREDHLSTNMRGVYHNTGEVLKEKFSPITSYHESIALRNKQFWQHWLFEKVPEEKFAMEALNEWWPIHSPQVLASNTGFAVLATEQKHTSPCVVEYGHMIGVLSNYDAMRFPEVGKLLDTFLREKVRLMVEYANLEYMPQLDFHVSLQAGQMAAKFNDDPSQKDGRLHIRTKKNTHGGGGGNKAKTSTRQNQDGGGGGGGAPSAGRRPASAMLPSSAAGSTPLVPSASRGSLDRRQPTRPASAASGGRGAANGGGGVGSAAGRYIHDPLSARAMEKSGALTPRGASSGGSGATAMTTPRRARKTVSMGEDSLADVDITIDDDDDDDDSSSGNDGLDAFIEQKRREREEEKRMGGGIAGPPPTPGAALLTPRRSGRPQGGGNNSARPSSATLSVPKARPASAMSRSSMGSGVPMQLNLSGLLAAGQGGSHQHQHQQQHHYQLGAHPGGAHTDRPRTGGGKLGGGALSRMTQGGGHAYKEFKEFVAGLKQNFLLALARRSTAPPASVQPANTICTVGGAGPIKGGNRNRKNMNSSSSSRNKMKKDGSMSMMVAGSNASISSRNHRIQALTTSKVLTNTLLRMQKVYLGYRPTEREVFNRDGTLHIPTHEERLAEAAALRAKRPPPGSRLVARPVTGDGDRSSKGLGSGIGGKSSTSSSMPSYLRPTKASRARTLGMTAADLAKEKLDSHDESGLGGSGSHPLKEVIPVRPATAGPRSDGRSSAVGQRRYVVEKSIHRPGDDEVKLHPNSIRDLLHPTRREYVSEEERKELEETYRTPRVGDKEEVKVKRIQVRSRPYSSYNKIQKRKERTCVGSISRGDGYRTPGRKDMDEYLEKKEKWVGGAWKSVGKRAQNELHAKDSRVNAFLQGPYQPPTQHKFRDTENKSKAVNPSHRFRA